jgi:hypothetical protein
MAFIGVHGYAPREKLERIDAALIDTAEREIDIAAHGFDRLAGDLGAHTRGQSRRESAPLSRRHTARRA